MVGSELIQIDRRTKKIMAQNKCHNISSAPERLYQDRAKGGRGLQSVQMTWEREAVAVAAYLLESEDDQVQGALELQALAIEGKYSYTEQAAQILVKYEHVTDDDLVLEEARSRTLVARLKACQEKVQEECLIGKNLHGIHAWELRKPKQIKKPLPAGWWKAGCNHSQKVS